MNDICDWPGCHATADVWYSAVKGRRREMCQRHFEEFLDIKERRGEEAAWRKLDARRKRKDDGLLQD